MRVINYNYKLCFISVRSYYGSVASDHVFKVRFYFQSNTVWPLFGLLFYFVLICEFFSFDISLVYVIHQTMIKQLSSFAESFARENCQSIDIFKKCLQG